MKEIDYMSLPNDISQDYLDDLVLHKQLPEAFIERFADRVDWDDVSGAQKLSEPFIAKHADEVEWRYISHYQELSEPFIKKYANKVDWLWISSEQKLSKSFVEKFSDKIVWNALEDNIHIRFDISYLRNRYESKNMNFRELGRSSGKEDGERRTKTEPKAVEQSSLRQRIIKSWSMRRK